MKDNGKNFSKSLKELSGAIATCTKYTSNHLLQLESQVGTLEAELEGLNGTINGQHNDIKQIVSVIR